MDCREDVVKGEGKAGDDEESYRDEVSGRAGRAYSGDEGYTCESEEGCSDLQRSRTIP